MNLDVSLAQAPFTHKLHAWILWGVCENLLNVSTIVRSSPLDYVPVTFPLLNINELGVLKTKASGFSGHIDYLFCTASVYFQNGNQYTFRYQKVLFLKRGWCVPDTHHSAWGVMDPAGPLSGTQEEKHHSSWKASLSLSQSMHCSGKTLACRRLRQFEQATGSKGSWRRNAGWTVVTGQEVRQSDLGVHSSVSDTFVQNLCRLLAKTVAFHLFSVKICPVCAWSVLFLGIWSFSLLNLKSFVQQPVARDCTLQRTFWFSKNLLLNFKGAVGSRGGLYLPCRLFFFWLTGYQFAHPSWLESVVVRG